MSNQIFQLVYLSRANPSISYTDLENILRVSRSKNERLEVTGILIYKDGYFVQLLEGPEENVLGIVASIVRDRRNSHMQIIHEVFNESRSFSGWTMAFRDGDLDRSPEKDLIAGLCESARKNAAALEEGTREDLMRPLAELGRRMKPSA